MTIDILAHRGNISGPIPSSENTLHSCRNAMENGFGLEIDLRRDLLGAFYISHDICPRNPENTLETYLQLFRSYADKSVAVNVKELGYESALLQLQQENTFGERDFYFDFELLEPSCPGASQHRLAGLTGGTLARMASRLSDRNEPLDQCLSLPCKVVWADEFNSFWLTETEINALRHAGRRTYVVSPELHAFSKRERLNRWAQFKSWNIDGLCTDYALEARDFFAK